MARIRTVKPEYFRHEGLQDLEAANPGAHTMLVFAGLWGHCDKAGRFIWKPRTLKLDILPFLEFDIGKTLVLLWEAGFINKYEVDGVQYGEIASFEKHQRISGKEAQEPEKYPVPCEFLKRSNGEAVVKHMGEQEGKGREREKEGKDSSEQSSAAPRRRHGSEDDHKAARWIFDRIKLIDETAKEPNWDSWANDIRLMREQDGKTHKEICDLFDWVSRDKFWRVTVLCPASLREKWTKLNIQRIAGAASTSRPNPDNFAKQDYGQSRDL